MRSRVLVLSFLFVLLSAFSAYSQCHSISTLPVTISTSGTWCLTGDLSYYGSGPAISVSASGVTVDLKGYRLGSYGSSGYGVYSYGGYNDLVVRDGEISASYRGIEINGATQSLNVTLRDLVISGFSSLGIYLNAQMSTIRDVIIQTPNGGSAWGIYTSNADIDHVRVDGSFVYGIYTNGNGFRTIRNSVVDGSSAAIAIYGAGTSNVVNNDVNGGLGNGVSNNGSGTLTVIGNRITSPAYPIIYSSGSGKYRDNVFLNSTSVFGGTDAGGNT